MTLLLPEGHILMSIPYQFWLCSQSTDQPLLVSIFRFMMVFLCLVLSVFSTIPIFEDVTGKVLYYMVSDRSATVMPVTIVPYRYYWFAL